MSVATFEARVIGAFGRQVRVRTSDGTEYPARPLGRALGIVCGDEVRCRHDERHGEVHVLEVLPRRTALYRTNARGRAEAVLANLTRLLVVIAPLPEPDLFVADRYLAAAASAGIEPILIVNKADLGLDAALGAALEGYRQADTPSIEVSAVTGVGEAELLAACRGRTAALVGQSGVGKSSLAARLAPEERIEVGALARAAEGRHTTTASRLFTLPGGGELIDAPGVRDFAPAIECLEPRTLGFAELARLAGGCRFLDCQHLREPDCAVRAAVEQGQMDPRRYESYRRLRRLQQTLGTAQERARRRDG
ncbi:MAG: ribosome small subunit-dependent GTPase A [Gammaproteobacteria bacterium]|nr:ribosome small subunit-dependent GTPase A [Gammaproteobacteria bacterium]